MSKVRLSASSPFTLVFLMACVAAGFFLMLKVVFMIHHDPQPAPLESRALTIIAVLIFATGILVVLFFAIQSGAGVLETARLRREARIISSRHAEERHRRVLELSADPSRAKYAPLIKRGEDWSDENIAYQENPNTTATCTHLQTIERTMRQAGIPVRRYRDANVSATCCIVFDRLQRDFIVVPPVRYAEFFVGERAEHDHPMAFLICDDHNSMIHTIHPEEAGAKNARLFPV